MISKPVGDRRSELEPQRAPDSQEGVLARWEVGERLKRRAVAVAELMEERYARNAGTTRRRSGGVATLICPRTLREALSPAPPSNEESHLLVLEKMVLRASFRDTWLRRWKEQKQQLDEHVLTSVTARANAAFFNTNKLTPRNPPHLQDHSLQERNASACVHVRPSKSQRTHLNPVQLNPRTPA